MTKDELTKLDSYGHKQLEGLTEDKLREYAILLERRRQEVLEYIGQLIKKRR